MRLWALQQMDPTSAEYNVPLALRLNGELELGALERALNGLVARHEVLRTTFAVKDGEPVQSISAELGVALEVIDLSGAGRQEARRCARERCEEEAVRPFDLARGPLLRAFALRIGPEEHVFLLVFHHIATDGWSDEIIGRELSELYDAALGDREADLAPLPIQYGDFAVWEREFLEENSLEQQLAFWQQRLQGVPTLELPTDKPRPAVRSGRGAVHYFELPALLMERLRALAREADTTLFITLLASYAILLRRLSGQRDFAIGTPIAGRPRPELESLIGFFINTLALRCDLGGEPSFAELLRRVRDETLEAFHHQDTPFQHLVEHLSPERDRSRTPIFQTLFQLDQGSDEWRLPGVAIEELPLEGGGVKVDLALGLTERPDGSLAAALEYSVDLFDAATAKRIASRFGVLLGSILDDPERPIEELEVLPGDERERILRAFSEMEMFVLDERLEPVPIGVRGELYIGGAGVARGYYRRPTTTAERFVPHPFSRQPGARLYRSGDFARFREDGNLEFLGRIDNQIDPSLPAATEEQGSSESEQRYVAARNAEEGVLVAIWAEVLGHDRVGINDRFFDLGGDSIRAVEAANAAQRQGLDVQPGDLFEHQTVAELVAAILDRSTLEGGRAEEEIPRTLVRLKPDGSLRPLFCVHPSGGSVAWYQPLARALPPERPLHAFQPLGMNSELYEQATMEGIASVYLGEMRKVQPNGPYALLGWSMGGAIALEMARQLQASGESVEPLLLPEPSLPGNEADLRRCERELAICEKAATLIDLVLEVPDGDPERDIREQRLLRFLDEVEWPRSEARLGTALPARAEAMLLRAYMNHVPDPYDGRIDLVVSEECVTASDERPSVVSHDSFDAYLAQWQETTGSQVEVHRLGRDHITMLQEPFATAMAALFERLAAAEAVRTPS